MTLPVSQENATVVTLPIPQENTACSSDITTIASGVDKLKLFDQSSHGKIVPRSSMPPVSLRSTPTATTSDLDGIKNLLQLVEKFAQEEQLDQEDSPAATVNAREEKSTIEESQEAFHRAMEIKTKRHDKKKNQKYCYSLLLCCVPCLVKCKSLRRWRKLNQ